MNIYLKYSMVENTPLLWNTFESIPLQYTRKHFFLWNTLRSIQCNMCEIMPLVYARKHWAGVPLKAFHWNTNSNTIKAK